MYVHMKGLACRTFLQSFERIKVFLESRHFLSRYTVSFSSTRRDTTDQVRSPIRGKSVRFVLALPTVVVRHSISR